MARRNPYEDLLHNNPILYRDKRSASVADKVCYTTVVLFWIAADRARRTTVSDLAVMGFFLWEGGIHWHFKEPTLLPIW